MTLTQQPLKRLYALDGLRGILALSVMLSHMIGVVTGWNETRPLIGAYISVIYFFIMSGFVLTYVHKNNYKFTHFILLRLARLWPLHCVTLITMVLIYIYNSRHMGYVAGGYIFNLKVIILNLLFLHGVTPYQFPLINDPSWSISIEFWASLLIPLIFLRIQPAIRLVISCGIIFLLCVHSTSGFINMSLWGMFPFLLAASTIMLGSAVYSLLTTEKIAKINTKVSYDFFLLICLLTCLFGIYGQTHNRLDFLYIV